MIHASYTHNHQPYHHTYLTRPYIVLHTMHTTRLYMMCVCVCGRVDTGASGFPAKNPYIHKNKEKNKNCMAILEIDVVVSLLREPISGTWQFAPTAHTYDTKKTISFSLKCDLCHKTMIAWQTPIILVFWFACPVSCRTIRYFIPGNLQLYSVAYTGRFLFIIIRTDFNWGQFPNGLWCTGRQA